MPVAGPPAKAAEPSRFAPGNPRRALGAGNHRTRDQILDQPGTTYSGNVAVFQDTDTSATFTASVNYGDGTIDTAPTIVADPDGGFDVLGNHAYATAATYGLTVTVHDSDSNTLQLQPSAYVANSFSGTNPILQGNWQGVYGTDGYDLSQVRPACPVTPRSIFLAIPTTPGPVVPPTRGLWNNRGPATAWPLAGMAARALPSTST